MLSDYLLKEKCTQWFNEMASLFRNGLDFLTYSTFTPGVLLSTLPWSVIIYIILKI